MHTSMTNETPKATETFVVYENLSYRVDQEP